MHWLYSRRHHAILLHLRSRPAIILRLPRTWDWRIELSPQSESNLRPWHLQRSSARAKSGLEPKPYPSRSARLSSPPSLDILSMVHKSRSFFTPNLPFLATPNSLLHSSPGFNPRLSSTSSFRSHSACSTKPRWHKIRRKEYKGHTNVYTNCGRHGDEWLFGGQSWKHIWCRVWEGFRFQG